MASWYLLDAPYWAAGDELALPCGLEYGVEDRETGADGSVPVRVV